jgi:hypothetical protein
VARVVVFVDEVRLGPGHVLVLGRDAAVLGDKKLVGYQGVAATGAREAFRQGGRRKACPGAEFERFFGLGGQFAKEVLGGHFLELFRFTAGRKRLVGPALGLGEKFPVELQGGHGLTGSGLVGGGGGPPVRVGHTRIPLCKIHVDEKGPLPALSPYPRKTGAVEKRP